MISNMSKMRDLIVLIILTLLVSVPGLSSLTVIDRDESRYAQATVQMLETGEYVDIRFQDAPRWKKPAGAYWAQAASIKTMSALGLSTPDARAIWVHRFPSVLAAILAVLATYFGGAKLVGRDGAFFGAMILAVSLSMMFEAHIAKTDALLTAFSTVCLASLCYLRSGAAVKRAAFIFWLSLGLAVMMKGPITPVIILTGLLALFIWERNGAWMKPLISPFGIVAFIIIVAPWTWLIWEKTGGDFFTVAVSEDLAPKMSGQSENHGGPVGYYLLTVWAMFWPGTAFLLAGLSLALRSARNARKAKKAGRDIPQAMPRAARLLLCWAVPWWIIVEIAPTKLPHYTLPVYPALALLAGTAAAVMIAGREFPASRRVGVVMFALIGAVLTAGLIGAQSVYGVAPTWEFAAGAIIIAAIVAGAVLIWALPVRPVLRRLGVYCVIASGAALGALSFGRILPAATDLSVSKNVAKVLTDAGYDLPLKQGTAVLSPSYAEPSLVYYLGTHIHLGGAADMQDITALPAGTLVLADRLHKKGAPVIDAVLKAAKDKSACFETLGTIDGLNYSKGDDVILTVMRATACP